MNPLPPFPERIQTVLQPGRHGVVDLVDGLLCLCPAEGFEIAWQDDRCCVRRFGVVPPETIEIPLARAVFRAVLARVAALCNDRVPDSVSPYGGEGELTAGTGAAAIFRAVFTNTPGEQRLEIRRFADGTGGIGNGHRHEDVRHGTRAKEMNRR